MRVPLLIIDEFRKLSQANPEYSFGELVYTILRKPNMRDKPASADIKWIREVSDNSFYTACERAIESEKEI